MRRKAICRECYEHLVPVDGYAVCPNGHGRLVRLGREAMGNLELMETFRLLEQQKVRRKARRAAKLRQPKLPNF